MAQFRAKKLDLGGFINPRIIRDHTKRKVFEAHEAERCALFRNPQQLTSFNAVQLLVPLSSLEIQIGDALVLQSYGANNMESGKLCDT